MESKSVRSVLVLIVLALGVVLGVVIVKRATRTPAAPKAAASLEVPAPRAPSDDRALVRVQRAGAVTAIERGDYEGAIATLSAIIKAGNGMGDEVELLKVAKELEEKYRASAEKPTPAKPAPSKPVPTPAPPAPARPTPAKKPARPVAKPTPTFERAEPVTGLLLVTSVPSGLMVELDGKRADNTPLRRRLEVGTHEVTVFRTDGQAFRRTVTVEEDGIATVDADVGEPPPPPEPKPLPPPPPEPAKPAPLPPEEKRPAPSPVASPAPQQPGPVGEVLVLQAGLVGDVFIGGVGYGPPPVLAKGIPAGEAAVELRSDGAVKRRKLVTVEAGHRVSVQFR